MRLKRILIFSISLMTSFLLLLIIGNVFLQMDFSQNYRKINGVENIVFLHNGTSDRFYKRCFWGLKRIPTPAGFKEEEINVPSSLRKILHNNIGDKSSIRQAIVSSDGEYILYSEIEYDYKNSGVSDDEYCSYKVYNIKTEEVVTIYQKYREWYNLDWQ